MILGWRFPIIGLDLKALNEGITAYKEEMYDRFLGIEPKTGYVAEKKVAKFIGDVIGIENLVLLHYNNDYEGIRNMFREKTGQELNDIIEQLNKKSEKIEQIMGYGIYSMWRAIKIEKIIRQAIEKSKKNELTQEQQSSNELENEDKEQIKAETAAKEQTKTEKKEDHTKQTPQITMGKILSGKATQWLGKLTINEPIETIDKKFRQILQKVRGKDRELDDKTNED